MNRHERRKAQKNKPSGGSFTENSPQLAQMDQASILQMREAVLAQQSGDHDSAEKVYRRLLKKFPNNPDCLNLLGVAMRNNGHPEESEKFIRLAIEQSPCSDFHKNLSNALSDQYKHEEAKDAFLQYLEHRQPSADENNFMGSLFHHMRAFEEALTYFQKSLVQAPDNANTLNNLGAVYLDMGNLEDAKSVLEQALVIDPDNAKAMTNYGLYYATIGKYEKARELYNQSLKIDPDNINTEHNLAAISTDEDLEQTLATFIKILPKTKHRLNVLKSIGYTSLKLGRPVVALDYAQQALALSPEDPTILTMFGKALSNLQRYDEAIPFIEGAIHIDPLNLDAYMCYGEINRKVLDYDFSLACYTQALTIKQSDVSIISDMAVVLQELGDYETSDEAFQAVFSINPNLSGAHYNRSYLMLRQARLKEGWEEYHWRYKCQGFWAFTPVRHFTQPEWEGTPLKGKSILAYSEQGIGDQIYYATVLPDLIAEGGDVTLEIEPRLVPLFQRSYPDVNVVPAYLSPDDATQAGIDYQIAMPDLCRFYRNDLSDFPSNPRPLVVDADEAAIWKKRFADISDRPKIGIGWRGGLVNYSRSKSYANLDELGPLLSIKGVDFINVQYSYKPEELDEIKERYGVELHTWDDLDMKDEQDRLAAMLSELDLVISPTTATAQLSGALGVDTFIYILRSTVTFNLGQDYAPWFKGHKIFSKENQPAEWEDTLNDIAAETRKLFKL